MVTVRKRWHLLPENSQAIEKLANSLKLSPLVAQLLVNRDITDPEQAKRFLRISMTGLHEPELLPGVADAAKRVYDAVREKRKICVYGDYDVDGISGTAILLSLLKILNADVEFHVPNRLDDGYGLNNHALRKMSENGVSQIVTVDCGIASIEEALEARRLGLELIVTDHHEFKPELPQADVLVHPRLNECSYPFGYLSGSGVAFKLAWAICKVASGGDKVSAKLKEFLLDAVTLASLGTVADVVPLCDENRILVHYGLARLRDKPGIGLEALLRAARLQDKSKYVATDIGFTLAPRLNAAGRFGAAQLAVEMLVTHMTERAEDLARTLDEKNQERQRLERSILADAKRQIQESNHLDRAALVLAHSQWHPGLIGIVAGRLSDEFARPTLMIAIRKERSIAVGSGRSVPGFQLHQALDACSSHLLTHGGHAAAAGFKLLPESILTFRDSFCQVVGEHFTEGPPAPRLSIDAEIPLSVLTMGLVEALGRLEPFGAGNAQPLFLCGDLQIVGEPRLVGNDRHLQFRVRQNSRPYKAIAFNMADRFKELMSGDRRCCVVFTPQINEWNNNRSVELLVKDFRPGPKADLE